MAELSTADKIKIRRGLSEYWSVIWDSVDLNKAELLSAVNATDTWIENNQSSFNNALPTAAKNNLTAEQKTLLFCAVAMARVSIIFARRIFAGAE